MQAFIRRKIKTEKKLGEILKAAREEKHFGLYYISKSIQIPQKYLQALEESQYDILPDQVYAKNFLKTYTKFLGLQFNQVYDLFKNEISVHQKTGKASIENLIPPKKASGWHFFMTPKLIKGLVIVLILLIAFLYLGIKIHAIFSPPALIVEQPSIDIITYQNQYEIVGRTESDALLKINNRQVLPDTIGNFEETINLNSGINIIIITAKKRYSREAVIERIIQVIE